MTITRYFAVITRYFASISPDSCRRRPALGRTTSKQLEINNRRQLLQSTYSRGSSCRNANKQNNIVLPLSVDPVNQSCRSTWSIQLVYAFHCHKELTKPDRNHRRIRNTCTCSGSHYVTVVTQFVDVTDELRTTAPALAAATLSILLTSQRIEHQHRLVL